MSTNTSSATPTNAVAAAERHLADHQAEAGWPSSTAWPSTPRRGQQAHEHGGARWPS